MTGCLVFIFGNARRVATEEVLNLNAGVQREVQMEVVVQDLDAGVQREVQMEVVVQDLDADVQREVQMEASIFDDIVQVDLVSWHGYKVSDVQARLYTYKYVCSI